MRLSWLVLVAMCGIGPTVVAPEAIQQLPDPPAAGQPAGSGAISGVVRDAATRRPIPGAVVYVGVQGRGPVSRFSRQVTDAAGRFVFTGLPASDSFFLQASKPGYFEGSYGRRGAAGVPGRIALGEADWVDDAVIEMWRPGAISGAVHDERGEPLVGVFVRVYPQVLVGGRPHLAAGATVTTDDRGAYRLSNLAPGRYLVSVPSVQISAPAAASLPADSPIARSMAEAAAVQVNPGYSLVLWQFPIPPPPAGRRPYAYTPVFYPNAATVAGATPIDLGYGDDRGAIDFVMAPVPTAAVWGSVEGPPEALANLTLRLVASGAEELGPASETATTVVRADGRFTFLSVPAGAYTLEASHTIASFESTYTIGERTSPPDQPGAAFSSMSTTTIASASPGTRIRTRSTPEGEHYWGRADVVVDNRDVTDVRVVMQPAARLNGSLVWDGRPPSTGAPGLLVMAEPASAAAADGFGRGRATSGDPNAFTIEGLRPGEFLRFLGVGSAVMKSVTWKGRDYTYQPIEVIGSPPIDDVVVTFTEKGASLNGIVRDEQGAPAGAATVIAFPAEREQWSRYGFTPQRIKRVAVANTSQYVLRPLPAGDYFVIAVDTDSEDGWKDPAFLDAAQAVASPVRLEWGDTKTIDLRLAKVRR